MMSTNFQFSEMSSFRLGDATNIIFHSKLSFQRAVCFQLVAGSVVMYFINGFQPSLFVICQHWFWGQVPNICISNLTVIGSDNGLSPGWCQGIMETSARILLIGPLETRICIWKCWLQNGSNFVSASMCNTKQATGNYLNLWWFYWHMCVTSCLWSVRDRNPA